MRGAGRVPGVRVDERRALRHLGRSVRARAAQAEEARGRLIGPVPVVVLAGSLGAGKTTVVNHVLRNSADTRIGVIVNDFGDIDVDGLLVAGQADMLVSASGGCLCCATDDGMVADFLRRLTAPRAGIDAVLVEASGVADPVQLVQRVVDDLGRNARFGGLVVLLDAEHTSTDDLGDADGQLLRGLRAADLVVVTKADRVDEGHLARLRAHLRAALPGRPVTVARSGAVDPALLFDLRHDPDRQLTLGDVRAGENAHLHTPFRSVSWTSETALHPRRLARLLDDGVPEAFRVKGFLTIAVDGYPTRWTVHRVGRHVRLTPGVPAGARRGTELVLIGPELGGSAYDELSGVVLAPGEVAGPDDLWGLERLVPPHLRPPLPVAVDEDPAEPGDAADDEPNDEQDDEQDDEERAG
ncbi:GTP-binding protein [Nocardioides zeae]|uniref:GTP-binding protein n=1 Tax=Nocardioides imazamoxiresistens TaxID=3231893 RepID=A0ABU3PU12_9ACTN|nr:GTP-binding protein [Nocardioides zeae]MDT9592684.1 GTP-binding protein [Nocardioides zeae]